MTIQHYARNVLCNLQNNSTTVCATGLTDDLPKSISYFEDLMGFLHLFHFSYLL